MIIPQRQVVSICKYKILSIIANDMNVYDIYENYMDTNTDIDIDI